MSRNRFIVEALEATLGTKEVWPPELVQMLGRPVSPAAAGDLERSLAVVRKRRADRRRAPRL